MNLVNKILNMPTLGDKHNEHLPQDSDETRFSTSCRLSQSEKVRIKALMDETGIENRNDAIMYAVDQVLLQTLK